MARCTEVQGDGEDEGYEGEEGGDGVHQEELAEGYARFVGEGKVGGEDRVGVCGLLAHSLLHHPPSLRASSPLTNLVPYRNRRTTLRSAISKHSKLDSLKLRQLDPINDRAAEDGNEQQRKGRKEHDAQHCRRANHPGGR